MVDNMDGSQEQHLPNMEEIASRLDSDQIIEFCESELFPETLPKSTSNCCYKDQSSYNLPNPSLPEDFSYENSNDNDFRSAAGAGNGHLSMIYDDSRDDQMGNDDISASIDFSLSPSFPISDNQQIKIVDHNPVNQEPSLFGMMNSVHQFSLEENTVDGTSSIQDANHRHHHHQYLSDGRRQMDSSMMVVAPPPAPAVLPILWPPLPHGAAYDNEESCGLLPPPPSYVHLRPSPAMIGHYLPPAGCSAAFSGENIPGAYPGTDHFSNQELEFQGGEDGLFMPDAMGRVFSCSSDQLQGLGCSESRHLVHASTSANPLASEISGLEDPTFKAGKLSVEERRRKIHRYMKKRNERNFSKKIKYACRKTLADSRPRVRGRFAKNEELGDMAGRSLNHDQDDTDDDVSLVFPNQIPPHHHQSKVVMKEEDGMEDSDIFAHISGLNSFKCNYPIQSWI